MPKRRRQPQPTPPPSRPTPPTLDLRRLLLDHLNTLKIAPVGQTLDALLSQAEQEGWSHLEFAHRLLGGLANQRRERAIERRIHDAGFGEVCLLEHFNWKFERTVQRPQIEELATGDFIRRKCNLVLVGQSGVGKSFLLKALGRCACVHGFRVRYFSSAVLLTKLAASLADQTLPQKIRQLAAYDLLVIDEFGFDRIERQEHPESANLLYKVLDARNQKRSTALATNVDFDAWGDYLGDPPLAMAFLDRLVDRAVILKITGKSYRASRSIQNPSPSPG
jgi:DNA replication protein DnaC